MRVLVQRVTTASVTGRRPGGGRWVPDGGLLALVGVTHDDDPAKAQRMAEKLWQLRILDDEKSASDVGAPILVVSQFTLYANTRRADGRHGTPLPRVPSPNRWSRPSPTRCGDSARTWRPACSARNGGRARQRRPGDGAAGVVTQRRRDRRDALRRLDDDEALSVERHLDRLAGAATDQRARLEARLQLRLQVRRPRHHRVGVGEGGRLRRIEDHRRAVGGQRNPTGAAQRRVEQAAGAMLPPFTRSMFQSRLDENASTFLPLIDRPEFVRFSRWTS